MGYWDYMHIGASALSENKRHIEKIFEYIGFGKSLDYSEGEECSFKKPDVYRCWSSENPRIEEDIFAGCRARKSLRLGCDYWRNCSDERF